MVIIWLLYGYYMVISSEGEQWGRYNLPRYYVEHLQ